MSAVDVTAVAGLSRTEAAMRAWTKAAERGRRLEAEAQSTFAELAAAKQACADVGIAVELELQCGIAAAYAEWKQRRAIAEARA